MTLRRAILVLVLAAVVVGVGACSLLETEQLGAGSPRRQNIRGLAVDANTSWAALDIDQTSTGNVAIFRDGGTAALTIADGGATTFASALTVNSNATVTGTLSVTGVSTFTGQANLVDDLKVGDGTPDVTLDGEDAYIEGTLEVDGASRFDGAMDLNGAVDLDGIITNADGLEHLLLPTYASQAFTYTAAAGGTVNLFTVGASEVWYVHSVLIEVTTDFDATGDDATVNIGDGNDEDGFCVLADAELQAADTEATGFAAGWQCQVAATRGVYQDGTHGFIYDGTDTIDAVIAASGDDLSAGAATAHIFYTRIQ